MEICVEAFPERPADVGRAVFPSGRPAGAPSEPVIAARSTATGLTHELLAAVVGARRPSVSVAVRRLAEQGRARSRPRSRWLLLGRPPAELRELHEQASGSPLRPQADDSADA